ncbi:MAG: methyltransferase [Frondihabitans sp.]|nr:methyltransferase [Frondihabitans sp.]
MTRIIAGFAGSTNLDVPRSGTRPTSDRVREALFSALEARDEIRGLRVVDLYAGTGALGLEAASRGASQVILVENAPQAARVCRTNAALVTARAPRGTAPFIDVANQSVRAFLQHTSPGSIDLAFIDPPYELDGDELARDLLALAPLLAPEALVVVERRASGGEPTWPPGLTLESKKAYGDTLLWLARAATPA